jgi:hypothetical protein
MPIVTIQGKPWDGDSNGEPPDNGDMEARVAKLEVIAEKTGERLASIDTRLVKIETRMDEFTKHYATKADLTDAKNSIIMWVVSAILLAQLLPVLLKKFGL